MAVTFTTEHADDVDTANAVSHEIGAAFTPGANSLLICTLALSDTAADYTTAVTGTGGETWVTSGLAVLRDNATIFSRTEVWYALIGGSPASTTVTATHSESITGCIGWIGEFAGHDTTTPIKQTNKDEAGTTDPSISLTDAPDSDSLVLAGATGIALLDGPFWVPEADWTEHQDGTIINPNLTGAVWSKAGDQSFTATGTDLTHASWIIEIDAAAGGGGGGGVWFVP